MHYICCTIEKNKEIAISKFKNQLLDLANSPRPQGEIPLHPSKPFAN